MKQHNKDGELLGGQVTIKIWPTNVFVGVFIVEIQ